LESTDGSEVEEVTAWIAFEDVIRSINNIIYSWICIKYIFNTHAYFKSFSSKKKIFKASDENGSVRFVRGSHKYGYFAHGKSGEEGNMLYIKQNIQLTEEQKKDVYITDLRPGTNSILVLSQNVPNKYFPLIKHKSWYV
jgi:hypothetical protein